MIKVKDIYALILEAFEEGKTFKMPVNGTSMQPLLHKGDLVTLKAIDSINKNDIIFYKRSNGQYVLHRVYKKSSNDTFNMIGDHQVVIEENVKREDCFAKVISYTKNDKERFLKGFRYKAYLLILKSFFLRRVLIKCLH